MREGFAKDFSLFALRKNIMDKHLPQIQKEYDVYFKRYVQTYVKETIRLYTSIKEFRLAKGM
jgi:hypothetical protein